MTDVIKTYQCAGDGMCIDPRCPTHSPPEMRALCARLTPPPSIALATMSARLALSRHGPLAAFPNGIMSRRACAMNPGTFRCSEEFYRIIDRISVGERP